MIVANKPKYTDEQVERVKSLYLDKSLTMKQVCKQSGLRKGQVDYILHHYGINKDHTRRRKYVYTPEQIAEMGKMYKEGCTYKEIAGTFGIANTSSLWKILVKGGVKIGKERKARDSKKATNTNVKSEQLCWKCAKAVGRCSWTDRTFTPVGRLDSNRSLLRWCAAHIQHFRVSGV